MRIQAKCIAYIEHSATLKNKWLTSYWWYARTICLWNKLELNPILTTGLGIFINDLKVFSTTTKIRPRFWKWHLLKVCHVQDQEKTRNATAPCFVAYGVLSVVW